MASSLRDVRRQINIASINIDSVNQFDDDDTMSTLIRSAEAARLLGVTQATLYAYVSRGRVSRQTAADGRASLFSLDEIEELARTSRRAPLAPTPTIDVQITSRVTTLSEEGVRYRGRMLAELVEGHHYEDVAELIWSSVEPPSEPAAWPTVWPAADVADLERCATVRRLGDISVPQRMAIATSILSAAHPHDSAGTAGRRLLLVTPTMLGSTRADGRYAERIVSIWMPRPPPEVVRAVDVAMMCLADHELATSTLAVRIAASVRTSPYGALAAGLAVVEGALHGSAAPTAHRFIDECASDGTRTVVRRYREEHRPIPGFGHKVYRSVDPRCELLLTAVRAIDPGGERMRLVDEVIAEVGRVLPHPPNVDVALGALTWVAGLDPDIQIFAIARVAGWAAHYAEELEERAVRFRGLARRP
jgi:citrate synthase